VIDGIEPLDLDGYQLWPDGSISVAPANLHKMIMRVPQLVCDRRLYVTELTDEVKQYNQLVDHPFTIKTSLDCEFPPAWNLPLAYKNLDIDEYLVKLADRVKHDQHYEARLERLAQEICLFKEHKLEEVLRSLIYIVEEFERQGVVWGVGRGSSCSSYLLYLIGLHEVDVVRYGISVTDFIRPL
jgi:DNA polymerase III alpha subunit